MNEKKKEFINNFVEKRNVLDEKNFDLVLKKLDDFFRSFFCEIIEENQGEVEFNLKLIGDYFLKTNYDFCDSSTIMVEYVVNYENYFLSEKRAQKNDFGKLLFDSFNGKNLYPTSENILTRLYNHLLLNLQNIKVFKRNNGIALRFLDYNFFIFIFVKTTQEKNYNFLIKGKEYSFNFDLMHENLLKKNEQTKGNFFKLIKFYKIIERELFLLNKLKNPNTKTLYFYENILYNIPNEMLMENFIFDSFLNSFAYLSEHKDELKNASNQSLFVENEYKLFAKYYVTKYDIKMLLKQCKIFIKNVDEIIK